MSENIEKDTLIYWNNMHKEYTRESIKYDDWLDEFSQEIELCEGSIIDLGCGSGNNTKYLIEKGKKVIACDLSENAVNNIKNNFPEIEKALCFDMSKGLPFEENSTDLIIADLSLHYFTKETTEYVLNEIKRVLTKKGLLIFRVNSINDVNHGAGQGKEVEGHLYKTENRGYKRFFDDNDIQYYFGKFEIINIKEDTMGRYGKEKVLWKGIVKNKKA